MKLDEKKYIELLGLSKKYFTEINPVDVLLNDLVSKQKMRANIEIEERLNDYFKKVKTKANLFFINKFKLDGNKYDFLFFINEPTHYNQVITILSELKKKEQSYLVLTNKINIFRLLQKNDINSKLCVLQNNQISDESLNKYKSNINDFISDISSKGMLSKEDIEIFSSVINKNFIAIFKYYMFFKSVLTDTSPKTVVIGNDLSLFGRILAFTCMEYKINTTVVQHGTMPKDVIHKYHLANNLFVFGEKTETVLRDYGIADERIKVTGAPYLDIKLFSKNKKNIENLKKYFKISESDKIVLVAFSGAGQRTSLEHHKKLIEAIGALAQRFSNYKFLIKLHRKDSFKFYSEISNQFRNVLIKPNIKNSISNDIFDWLELCEMLITGNSSVATEAMLMKKPVMTIDLMNEYPFMDFIHEGITLHSKTIDELKNNFESLMNNYGFLKNQLQKQTVYINQYFFNPDGKTSKRCVELLETKK